MKLFFLEEDPDCVEDTSKVSCIAGSGPTHTHFLCTPSPSTGSPLLACYEPHILSPSRTSQHGIGTSKPLVKVWRENISDFDAHIVPIAPAWFCLYGVENQMLVCKLVVVLYSNKALFTQ